MLPLRALVLLLSLLAAPAAVCGPALGEVIYLKDGTRIEAGKVWEEDGLIRFHLKGYRDIIITYSKDIVERIEKDGEKVWAAPAAAAKDPPAPPSDPGPAAAAGPPEAKAEKPSEAPPPPPVMVSPPDAHQGKPAPPPRTVVKPPPPARKSAAAPARPDPAAAAEVRPLAGVDFSEYDGIEFYNPRRAYKYQTGADRYHRTLDQALAALAQTVGRPPEWVAEHIGNSNDLGMIYRNLSRQAPSVETDEQEAAADSGVLFYDPRRTNKYWTSKNARHRTFEEAVAALATEYGRSPDWIRAHLGESNDLGAIHRSLTESKAAEAKPSSK